MANVKISELPTASGLNTTDLVPIVQSGVTKQTTAGAFTATMTGYIQAGSGTSARTAQAKLRSIVSIEDFGGSASALAATNDTALDAAITYLSTNGGDIIFESPGDYQFAAQHNLPRDINLIGQHTPGADATNAPAGTRINRAGSVILFNLVGTNRTTDRVGRNLFRGIQFVDDANISSSNFFNCKYADSLVFENCSFWQPDGQVTAGHFIYAEECWDWRFWNVMFKHYGTSGGKDAIYVYNGTTDNSNGWKFYATRWQEGQGRGIFFDSSGVGGSQNHDFDFIGCKWEDTGNASLTHMSGVANNIHVIGGEMAGCGERQVSQAATATRWRFSDVTFANGGNTATEMIELLGNRSRIAGCTFQNPGSSVAQYVNTTAADTEVTGCNRASTVIPLVNTSSVNATSKIHHNTDFVTEYGASATISSGNSSVTISHNQSYTPNAWDITVQFTGVPNGIDALRITSITSTQFTVLSYLDGVLTTVGGDTGIAWKCIRVRG